MKNQKYCMSRLLEHYDVTIPIVQRDYAHGRENPKAKQVRDEFITSLWDSIENEKGLHLDFVYGRIEPSREESSRSVFIPFDGQQRLTTLFLFHRYVYEKVKGKDCMNSEEMRLLKNFSYATRPTARDFCKQLCSNRIFRDDSMVNDISNEPWFNVSWLHDPTVKGMCCVLSSINECRKDNMCTRECLDRLGNITFTLANMGDLNMSDMNYISMNAKGRPLSPWENFKASLLEQCKEIITVEAKKKLDGSWCDLFFESSKRSPGKSGNRLSYDYVMMGMVHLHLSNLERSGKTSDNSFELPLFKDIYSIPHTPFSIYAGQLENGVSLNSLFAFWDALKEHKQNMQQKCLPSWDEKAQTVTSEPFACFGFKNEGLTYPDRVIFHSVLQFFYYHPKSNNLDLPESWMNLLGSWMRVVWNIVENSSIWEDNYSSYLSLMSELAARILKATSSERELWKKLRDIDDETAKISKDQLREEKLKAKILYESKCSKQEIADAEKDAWCRGKIGILLNMDTITEEFDISKFNDVFKRLNAFRRRVSDSKNRPNFLKNVFNEICRYVSNIDQLWGMRITFPDKDILQWKHEINRIDLWKKLFHKIPFENDDCFEAEPIGFHNQALDTLNVTYKQVFSSYARLWPYWGEYRIATKPTCRYQNCFYMDAYGEMEALASEKGISMGWGSRGEYQISKNSNATFVITKKCKESVLGTHVTCVKCFKGLQGDFTEKLDRLINV